MKVAELKKDQIVNDWLGALNPKAHTERNYLLALQIYTDFLNKSPEDLITEAEGEAGILMRQRHIKSYLINFRKYLQDSRAPTTIKSYTTGVISFYSSFDIELPKLPRQKNRTSTLDKNNKVPNKEDLAAVLKICDVLEKAILLTGASSGLSAAEICNLKVKDFNYDEDYITTLELTRQKTGVRFCTFLSPECTHAILDYLDFRNREGKTKRCVQHEKQKVLSDENYLFIKRHIPATFSASLDDNERALDLESLVKLYRGISTKARKNTPIGTWNYIRSHTTRKFFNSSLYNAGCQAWAVEYFMGHSMNTTQAAYYRPDISKLKAIYKKFIPYLTISTNLDVLQSQEFQDLINERDHYKGVAAEYVTTGLELIEAQYEIKKLKSKLLAPEERKRELLDWMANKIPEDDNEAKWLQELKKTLNLTA